MLLFKFQYLTVSIVPSAQWPLVTSASFWNTKTIASLIFGNYSRAISSGSSLKGLVYIVSFYYWAGAPVSLTLPAFAKSQTYYLHQNKIAFGLITTWWSWTSSFRKLHPHAVNLFFEFKEVCTHFLSRSPNLYYGIPPLLEPISHARALHLLFLSSTISLRCCKEIFQIVFRYQRYPWIHTILPERSISFPRSSGLQSCRWRAFLHLACRSYQLVYPSLQFEVSSPQFSF